MIMTLNFNVQLFCENLKATKPPYECPVHGCGKIYKSYAGIQSHLYNHDNPDPGMTPGSHAPGSSGHGGIIHRMIGQTSGKCLSSVERGEDVDGSSWVEMDLSGCIYKINIHEPLMLINDEVGTERTENKTLEGNPSGSKDVYLSHKTDGSTGGQLQTSVKLPEAHFKLLDNYVRPNNVPPKPSNYYRFIEKTQEELDEEVEYDLDEEDFVWLELMNEKRQRDNLPSVSKDNLELLMDRLEKNCYFEVKSRRASSTQRDEDAICSVCLDGECHINNVILFCDLCNLAVHQECYGVPHIPEGSWICRRCLLSPSHPVDCCLCPNKRGAFKQTEDGRWAHVVCAVWIPEVGFANSVFLEPIDGIERIAAARWKLVCYICKQRSLGACIQCHKTSCYTAFHVTCAQQAGLYMKTEPVRDLLMSSGGAATLNLKKTVFCDVHSPTQNESSNHGGALSSSEEDRDSSSSSLLPAEARAKSKLKLRKARKALVDSRNSPPTLSIPVISPNSIKEISDKVSIRGKVEFIRRLCSYWSLKRQSRNGVPLLRTSMSSIPTSRNRGGKQLLHSPISSGGSGQKKSNCNVSIHETSEMSLEEQFTSCKKLRQELEKVRLLNELIRKREKMKLEQVKVHEKVVQLELFPLLTFLSKTLDEIQAKDVDNLFPDLSIDKNVHLSAAIDFNLMRSKVSLSGYTSVDDLAADFDCMISDYMKCNAHDNRLLKACSRLQDQGNAIIKSAKNVVLKTEFDLKPCLLHLSKMNPIKSTENPDESIKISKIDTGAENYRSMTVTSSITENPTQSEEKYVSSASNVSALTSLTVTTTPVGVNRRSAVLHSKKAKQTALRMFHVANNITPNVTPKHDDPPSLFAELNRDFGNNMKNEKPPLLINEKTNDVDISESLAVVMPTLNLTDSRDAFSYESSKTLSVVATEMVTDGNRNEVNSGCRRKRSNSELNTINVLSDDDDSTNHSNVTTSNDISHHQYSMRGRKVRSFTKSVDKEMIVPLEPLDLVWAKCTGFPWYPAIVIDPKMSKSGAFHNSVKLPFPPSHVLNLRRKHDVQMFLVSFFDARHTWQWLPRNKLDPLGVDSGLDEAKLADTKKHAMRKTVRQAYQKAIQHRCAVTGEPFNLTALHHDKTEQN